MKRSEIRGSGFVGTGRKPRIALCFIRATGEFSFNCDPEAAGQCGQAAVLLEDGGAHAVRAASGLFGPAKNYTLFTHRDRFAKFRSHAAEQCLLARLAVEGGKVAGAVERGPDEFRAHLARIIGQALLRPPGRGNPVASGTGEYAQAIAFVALGA